MMTRRSVLLLAVLLLVGLAPARAQEALAPVLDKILDAPALKGGITGAIVCRAGDGRVVYAHDADTRLIPASNRKLFTSAAALEVLGDDFRIHTDLRADARPDAAGTIGGSLYLRGGGDGLLSPDDLDAMARTLASSGVKRVTGYIVGDGSLFTDGPYGFGWEWDDFSDEEFPQISALEVNEGVLGVHVAPGRSPGDPVTVTLTPPTDYLPVVVAAKTGPKDALNDCAVSRPWDKNYFLVTGTLPPGATLTQNVPVKDPPLLAATLLRQSLARVGVVVTGRAVLGQTPPETILLASHASLPLAQYLPHMNKPSDNLLAECLVRLTGARGTQPVSYAIGHARETSFLRSLGVDTQTLGLVDGCGVGRRNFVTARAVSQLLVAMHKKADWRVWYDSLPIAGVDGTLQSRMKGTSAANNVHAKTGTLSQVRALSGYVTGRSGTLYVFSLLMNNFPGTARQAGNAQDAFAEYLASHL
jgi:D-alanyl-D-alanine carboxypeptidase/D-alanyl-D-alanine-endopeptidase (penicillin-binding protein 4)